MIPNASLCLPRHDNARAKQIAGDAQHKLERGEPLAPLPSIDPRAVSISGYSSGGTASTAFHLEHARRLLGSASFGGSGLLETCSDLRNEYCPRGRDHTYKLRVEGRTMCDGCRCNDTAIERHSTQRKPDKHSVCQSEWWPAGEEAHRQVHRELLLHVQLRLSGGMHAAATRHAFARDGLRRTRLYLFRGASDPLVTSSHAALVGEVFRALGANVSFRNSTPVECGHCWPHVATEPTALLPTVGGDDGAVQCCGIDGPGEALEHLHGPALLPPRQPPSPAEALRLQRQLRAVTLPVTAPHYPGRNLSAFLYVPTRCETWGALPRSCALHVALHGCVARNYYAAAVASTSFNAWGEANNIVIAWPYIGGCWDERPGLSRVIEVAINTLTGGAWSAL